MEHNFTNLSENTDYTVYYMATNEDPKFFLERTPIFNLTSRTKPRIKFDILETGKGSGY